MHRETAVMGGWVAAAHSVLLQTPQHARTLSRTVFRSMGVLMTS